MTMINWVVKTFGLFFLASLLTISAAAQKEAPMPKDIPPYGPEKP